MLVFTKEFGDFNKKESFMKVNSKNKTIAENLSAEFKAIKDVTFSDYKHMWSICYEEAKSYFENSYGKEQVFTFGDNSQIILDSEDFKAI